MDRDRAYERVKTVHLRILTEEAEAALEQERAARETADRAQRLLRSMPLPPIRGR